MFLDQQTDSLCSGNRNAEKGEFDLLGRERNLACGSNNNNGETNRTKLMEKGSLENGGKEFYL